MKFLGISCYYHEAAAALVIDGKVVAASAEERFTRTKHDQSFPKNAIKFCLDFGSIEARDLDFVVFYEKPFQKLSRNLDIILRNYPSGFPIFREFVQSFLAKKIWVKSEIAASLKIDSDKILFVPHHLSHAASAYFASPFNEAAYLTLDAVGEWSTGSYGEALGDKMTPLREMRFPDSVGFLYSAVTSYLGFEVNEGEYKVMGLAGYGQPKHQELIKKLYRQNRDSSIELNQKYFNFKTSNRRIYSDEMSRLFRGLKKEDIAASLQSCTEEIILAMARQLFKVTGQKNLVYAGGVALNSVANGRLIRESGFKNVFVFPAAGDDGGAVGAALYVSHLLSPSQKSEIADVFLGPEFSSAEIEDFLKSAKIKYKKLSQADLIKLVARRLAEGAVVGWFEGRAEFGPRALGHRSILADPRNTMMKEVVNSKIKFREEFRPFAPAVLAEDRNKYFSGRGSWLEEYMLATLPAKPLARRQIPAVVHVDGSSRIQLVTDNYSGRLRELLREFKKDTSVGALLNTSFNLKGEPIVGSPSDAYNSFKKSGLDILVLENSVIEK